MIQRMTTVDDYSGRLWETTVGVLQWMITVDVDDRAGDYRGWLQWMIYDTEDDYSG